MGSNYMYVLDFCTNTIGEIKLDKEDSYLETEDILRRRGLNIDECHFMFSDYKLELETINIEEK